MDVKLVKEVKLYKNVVNGQLVEASNGRKMDVINPATGQIFAQISLSTKEDVEYAVKSAKEAFKDWAPLTAIQRAEYLRKVGDSFDQYGEELAQLETQDTGWVIRESLYGLIPILKQIWHDAAAQAIKANRGESVPVTSTNFGYTIREPLGVVVGIIPWNAPLFTLSVKAAYAIASGNTAIIKPSELASVECLRFGEIANTILPPGVLNVIAGDGIEIGDTLVAHPDVNRVSLTGSGQTASKIVQSTAKQLKPLTFELGGKSPNIVFEDADLTKAVFGVTSSIFTGNAGQICVAGSRILVQRSILDDFLKSMKEVTFGPLKFGNTLDPTTTMGPIANKSQYEKVVSYIQDGVEEGGKLIFGGRNGGDVLLPDQESLQQGYWVEPTLLLVDKNSYRVCQEEIFGPVAVVIPFDSEDEAIEIANDTQFGLGAGVWTSNLMRAQRMVQKIDAGNVWVNTYRVVGVELPFGGFKQSGFGKDSILENTREKTVMIEIG